MDLPSERVVVEVSACGDPIAGEVAVAGGAARPFTGWLQLLSMLQDAFEEHEARAGGEEP